MASGLTVNGTDLDAIIKGRSTVKRADVAIQVAASDISNRFEKTAGGDLPPNATNFKSSGSDLKTLFQDVNFGGALYATASNYTPTGGNIGNGPFTTPSITITPGGGNPAYSYAWARQSGDATISISSATSATPSWTASGTAPTPKTAVWRCTVTDSLAHTATVDVTVTVNFYSALTATNDKGSVSGAGNGNGPFSTDTVSATPAGGSGGYSYLWQYVSGDGTISPASSAAAATAFSASNTAPANVTAVWRLRVTDNLGNVSYSANVTVNIIFNVGLSVTCDKSGVSATVNFPSFTGTTDAVTASPSGGSPAYSYLWEMVSGDGTTYCNSATSAATTFGRNTGFDDLYTSTWRCRVTDSLGSIAYSPNVTVQLNYLP